MSNFQDIDMYGDKKANGDLKEYIGSDAIKNALQLWLSSKRGEFLNNPSVGGPLDSFVFKSMNIDNLTTLRFGLWSEIDNNFSPAIELIDIIITPDYNNKVTEIEVIYIIPDTGEQGQVTIFTNSQYSYNQFNYVDVEEIGENLKTFFQIKKPSMTSARLLYDYDGNFWKWGKYKLVNLVPTDPYFEEILIIANT